MEHALKQYNAKPDIEMGEFTKVLWGISWSGDGKRLASIGADGTARVWDATTSGTSEIGRELLRFKTYAHYGMAIAFSPDGSRLAMTNGRSVTVVDAFNSYAREKSR